MTTKTNVVPKLDPYADLNRWEKFDNDTLVLIGRALEDYAKARREVLSSEVIGLTHDYTPMDRQEIREKIDTLEDLLTDLDWQRKYTR